MRDATQPQMPRRGRIDLSRSLRHDTANAALHSEPSFDDGFRQTVIRPWSNLLERTIATDVLPIMLAQRGGRRASAPDMEAPVIPTKSDVETFVSLILVDKITEARAMVEQMAARGLRRDDMLHGLLAPAARRFGELWDRDRCDFAAVTLGMIRLNQIMRDTAEPVSEAPILRGRVRHLLIAAAPGEQHSFGVSVISDLFRRAGWFVQSEPIMSRASLMSTLRRNWFDVVGISVSTDRGLKGLPGMIRALRQTALNPVLGVLVGGKVFVEHPERAQFVGADAMALDGQQALFEADTMVERSFSMPA
ncbi:cobalamin B12-binding domain-containing protein [Acidiphilium sp.]|uniref:cobalamin B12-binding domain-containing protein n=1 Tax=Acidiphilium sp. TaxID=527 RepID=UPI003CFD2AED